MSVWRDHALVLPRREVCRVCEEPIAKLGSMGWFHDLLPIDHAQRLDTDHSPVTSYIIEEEP